MCIYILCSYIPKQGRRLGRPPRVGVPHPPLSRFSCFFSFEKLCKTVFHVLKKIIKKMYVIKIIIIITKNNKRKMK